MVIKKIEKYIKFIFTYHIFVNIIISFLFYVEKQIKLKYIHM